MKLITLKQLSQKLGGRSRSSIYNDLKANRIPQPFKIGSMNYWNEGEIETALRNARDVNSMGPIK